MDDKKWERWGLHGGLIGVALLVATVLEVGRPPDSDAPAPEIADWYADKSDNLQIGAVLVGLAVIGIVWWFGSLFRYLRRAEGGEPRLSLIAAFGVLISGAMAMTAFAMNSAVAMRIGDVGTDAGVFFGIQNGLLGMSAFGAAILIVAVSAIAIRTKFLPDWLAYGGTAVAVMQLLGALVIATQNTAISYISFIAFLLWLAWIAAVSLVLYARKTEPTAAA
jgi:hypothetical protein